MPPPIHLPHFNPREHVLPEHPQIHAHPVERPSGQRRPVRRATANGAVVGALSIADLPRVGQLDHSMTLS